MDNSSFAEIFLIIFMLASFRFGKIFAVTGVHEAMKAHPRSDSHVRAIVLGYFLTSMIIYSFAYAVALALLAKIIFASKDTLITVIFGNFSHQIIVVSIILASATTRTVMLGITRKH